MSNRIASFTGTQSSLSQIMRLQSSYAKANAQISSGVKSENFTGIAGVSRQLLKINSTSALLTAQSANATAANNTVQSMYDAVSSLTDVVTQLRTSLSASNATATSLQASANDALSEVTAQLNTEVGGSFLFSGTANNVAPVDLTGYPAQTSPSSANTSYYKGDAATQSVTIGTLKVNYGLTADSPAFEQAIRGLKLVASNPSDKTATAEAYTLLTSALDGLGNIKATLGVQSATLERQTALATTTLTQIQNNTNEISGTDISAVTIQTTNLQTQLQASYSVLSKILNLRLSDYLK